MCFMADTTYDKPSTVRLNSEELKIVERIRTESAYGVVLSSSDAMKIALHEWELAHPQKQVIDPPFRSFPGQELSGRPGKQ